MNKLKSHALGIRVLLVLGMLLVMATASVDNPASVSAHGGDTTIVHLCVNDANAETLTVFPLPIGNANIDCFNPPWPLGPGWSPVDVGTISGVTAGTGLTGGGTIGPVTLDADTTFLQRRATGGCVDNQHITGISATGLISCGADSGDIAGVTAGTGLTGGGTTGPVTLDADTTFLQQRVSGICGIGSSIRVINGDGTVSCETGLAGTGTLNRLTKFTSSVTVGNSVMTESAGKIGVGIDTPRTDFDVLGGRISAGGAGKAGAMTFFPPDGFAFFHIDNGPAGGRPTGRLRFSFGVSPGDFEVMSILQNRRVGIGTTSPNEQLEITGNLRLPKSTATTGVIKSDGNRIIHNFGTDNFFAGVNAGNLTMTGLGGNTGVGVEALSSNTTGRNNTASGALALQANTTGNDNTATGRIALLSNTTGSANTATGRSALVLNTTGINNTATGHNALLSNTTGSANTATGRSALLRNTTGINNTAAGSLALRDNTTGFANTASGALALLSNTTGINNTATGHNALESNTTGSNNTAFGRSALFSNTTGSEITAIGRSADVSAGNLTNATAIGYEAVVNASDKIRLGNSNVTVIEGQVSFTAVSDANQKENFLVVDGEETLEKISQMTLDSWNYKGHDPQQFRHYGPTAQDFFAAFGDDGFGTVGTDTTINSGDMAGIMMIAIQALERRTAQVAELQAQMQGMEERLKALEAG